MTKENDSKKAPAKQEKVQYIPVQYLDSPDRDDEINLFDLIEVIWNGRRTILKITVVFLFIGLFHLLAGPEEYESEAILLQENRQGQAQNLRLLQSLSGVNFGSGSESETISASLYPRIIESVEFQHRLLQHEVQFESIEQPISLYRYFNEYYSPSFRKRFYKSFQKYTIRLPITIYNIIRNLFISRDDEMDIEYSLGDRADILNLNPDVRRAISEMRERITLDFEGSLITVKTRLPDPLVAAEVNLILIKLIQEYVISYRSEKARQNLEFVQSMYDEARARYEEAQLALASFTDANRGNLTATARIEEERLSDEKNLTFSIYNSIAQRLEDSRLRLQEETPVFSKLQNPDLPNSPTRSSPLIIIASIILGAFMGVFWIFSFKVFGTIKEKMRNADI